MLAIFCYAMYNEFTNICVEDMYMGKVVLRKTDAGFSFRVKAGNGQIIGVSEVYTTKEACKKGIASVAKNAPIAPVEDQTVEPIEAKKCPKFEIYKDKKDKFRFRLKARNGEIILSGEAYEDMNGCQNGVESVRKNADSEIAEEE